MASSAAVDSLKRQVIGRSFHELDTPALLLDIDLCQGNLQKMASFFAGKKSQLRPHFKNHKCVSLARRQLSAGSIVGLTCAKLSEAEILADHGVTNILIANQVVGQPKVRRLIDVARHAEIAVAIDDVSQAKAISEVASEAGVTIGTLVEVDIGMSRCGVGAGEPALELARKIVQLPGTDLKGIQAFEGHAIYINDAQERARLVRRSLQLALDTRELIELSGVRIGVISGGSTANHQIVVDMVDEVQAGTYATMDWRYQEMSPEFDIALTILAMVISKRAGEAVLDVGVKAAGAEFGDPKILGAPEVEIPVFKSEEHCVLKNTPEWRVGDTIQLIPSHACTTCNLYRQMFVHQDGKVVDIWPIEASGILT